ncbi:MAG: phosphatidylglycerophosphatase A [Pseudomonadota bacterium]|nr:phosphatidylglycerophosphatase A [Pseudomonadota bacterium]
MQDKGRIKPDFDWRKPHHWLAYGFGSGLSPWAPGTAGTLAAIPLYLLLRPLPVTWYLAVLLGLFLIGIWACGKTARELNAHDPAPIVWDEFLGYLLTMTAAPTGWVWVVLGFVLFRFFDILKPWPILELDRRVHGGLGVILDDLLAGLMAWAVLQALVRFWA